MMTLRGFFRKLAHPDSVGQSEYRLLHDFVEDLIENAAVGTEPEDRDEDFYNEEFNLIDSSLKEVAEIAEQFRRELAQYRAGIVKEEPLQERAGVRYYFTSLAARDAYIDKEFPQRRPSKQPGFVATRGPRSGWLKVEGLIIEHHVQMPR